ncbi:inositol polyphosphate multikinase PWA37_000723 [Arxiozyma heterogenica]|uniref:Kinase n=1 Tax=Arxiozyma heterogenica TaxID=278026 RepID=A0AAN7WK58_9SACH|nr:hypothetical protein RI543_000608 [Kazachstania heterogenica]
MSSFKILEDKAAGHDGTLTDNDGLLIFKPLNEQELQFYQKIQSRYQNRNVNNTEHNGLYCGEADDENDDDEIPLQTWMPTFLGVLNEGKQMDTHGNHSYSSTSGNMTIIPDDSDIHLQTIQIANPLNNDSSGAGEKRYLVLENLLAGFNKPNIMDIKLGKILYDENASLDKKQRLQNISNTSTSGSLGFRICGMQLQKNSAFNLDPKYFDTRKTTNGTTDNESIEYILVNKIFGRSRTIDNIKDAITLYFNNQNLSKRRINILIDMFLTRLQLFYNTLLSEEVRMISSSLLFIYEGDHNRWDLKNDEDDVLNNVFIEDDSDMEDDEGVDDTAELMKNSQKYPLSSMTLIDFAHSKLTPGEGYDENVIEGVESLINIFIKIKEEST